MTTSTITALLRNVEFPYQDIAVSDDGYIRLTADSIRSLIYIHLISGLDEGVESLQLEGAVTTHISGYTEWVSQTVPVITLGWDWFLDYSSGEQKLLRVGKPCSNVMSVDCNKQDLGYSATLDLLCSFVDEMDWQLAVMDVIRKRYTPCQH
jgi:hypothetical protein